MLTVQLKANPTTYTQIDLTSTDQKINTFIMTQNLASLYKSFGNCYRVSRRQAILTLTQQIAIHCDYKHYKARALTAKKGVCPMFSSPFISTAAIKQ